MSPTATISPALTPTATLPLTAAPALTSRILINAPVHVVRRILLDPSAIPEWNPAFRAITAPATATANLPYPIETRDGLLGHYEFRSIIGTRIEAQWDVPGFTEHQLWELSPYNYGTHVRHTVEHRGNLTSLLRPAFASAASLRLNRLAQRAENRASTTRTL
ncbi:hypothetical protein [Streptomyces sp. NBC_01190]|uniref:hypothetical protein n=1 Tax=Streptomyces sp. NBC_01190 TaxID=2903767 RepID=UPI00386BD192|nr:hypothetical protein OG519_31085 [Streptomyces sp. NBC_01190]